METWELVIVAVLLFIAQGFATWYFAYFKKHGENQAIKESIEQITRTTESIKKELDLITENEISFRSERRNTIIKYFETVDLIYTYLTLQMQIHEGDDVAEEYFGEHYPPYSILASKLDLFVESPEIRGLSADIGTIFTQIVEAASNRGMEISEVYNSGGNSAHEKVISIMKQHNEYLSSIQRRFFDLREELMIKFREILKQEFANKS